jgi:lycopene beta-cyclase
VRRNKSQIVVKNAWFIKTKKQLALEEFQNNKSNSNLSSHFGGQGADLIICGAGCAGLSLAMHMIHSGKFSNKRILLIDKDPKRANDRTWCFWQKEEGLFESIICKQWNRLWFHGENFSDQLHIEPYQYKMIRGIDFYEYCFNVIRQQKNFDVLFEKVDHVFSDGKTGVIINGKKIYADYVFNSILFEKPKLAKNDYWMLQHFKGWVVETEENCFDEDRATLMDFRNQGDGAAFCYVLPFNSKKALIEYTLFSPQLLQQEQYDEGLRSYIADVLKIPSYTILEREFGVIPMTNFKFPSGQNNIINIGTAGGQTKGSSGYTFNFIQKHSRAIVGALLQTGRPFIEAPSKRFNFYDSVLLKVLSDGSVPGQKVFTDLFKNNPVQNVLKFLDNETSISEEIKIISSLPTLPFLKAGIQHMI